IRLGIITHAAKAQVKEPVAFVVPRANLVLLVREEPPVARFSAVAAIGEGGVDFEAFAVAELAVLRETGSIVRIAPEQDPLRTHRPELVDHFEAAWLGEQGPVAIAVLAVVRVGDRGMIRESHMLAPELERDDQVEPRLQGRLNRLRSQ